MKRENRENAKQDLQAYLQSRLALLPIKPILESTGKLFSEESIHEDDDFEKEIGKRLENGAKFIPRKRPAR